MTDLWVNMDKSKFFSRLQYAFSLLWNILLIAADWDCRISSLPLAYLGLVLGSYFAQKTFNFRKGREPSGRKKSITTHLRGNHSVSSSFSMYNVSVSGSSFLCMLIIGKIS